MKHINKLYHNDDDEYSPFWSRTFSDMEEWNDKKCLNEFKKKLNNLTKKYPNSEESKYAINSLTLFNEDKTDLFKKKVFRSFKKVH